MTENIDLWNTNQCRINEFLPRQWNSLVVLVLFFYEKIKMRTRFLSTASFRFCYFWTDIIQLEHRNRGIWFSYIDTGKNFLTMLTLYGRMLPNGNKFAVGGYGIFKKLGRLGLIPITKQQRIYRKIISCSLFSGSRP
jgi:hypothetical protein